MLEIGESAAEIVIGNLCAEIVDAVNKGDELVIIVDVLVFQYFKDKVLDMAEHGTVIGDDLAVIDECAAELFTGADIVIRVNHFALSVTVNVRMLRVHFRVDGIGFAENVRDAFIIGEAHENRDIAGFGIDIGEQIGQLRLIEQLVTDTAAEFLCGILSVNGENAGAEGVRDFRFLSDDLHAGEIIVYSMSLSLNCNRTGEKRQKNENIYEKSACFVSSAHELNCSIYSCSAAVRTCMPFR